MAFKGDFEKLDDEIKVQVKALAEDDIKTYNKLNAQEMSPDDQVYYLMTQKQKDKLKKDMDEDHYDTDLERTMF